jgi:hypothetical protein
MNERSVESILLEPDCCRALMASVLLLYQSIHVSMQITCQESYPYVTYHRLARRCASSVVRCAWRSFSRFSTLVLLEPEIALRVIRTDRRNLPLAAAAGADFSMATFKSSAALLQSLAISTSFLSPAVRRCDVLTWFAFRCRCRWRRVCPRELRGCLGVVRRQACEDVTCELPLACLLRACRQT